MTIIPRLLSFITFRMCECPHTNMSGLYPAISCIAFESYLPGYPPICVIRILIPSVSIVFSLAVALVVVFKNGLDVKVVKFGEEMDRSEFGRKLVVRDTVYVAPFPMKDPIVCSRTALVTVDSGGEYTSGECVVLTPDSLELRGNWTPCLWPVRVRELEVVRTGKEASK